MDFECIKCRKKYKPDDLIWQCECGGCLFYQNKALITRDDINPQLPGMWRYEKAYPLKYKDLKVTFNEGFTPLVPLGNHAYNIRIKMDSLMPTGSFKDRGTVMVVNHILNHGIKSISEDSSGNAGASVAAYCALAGIPCDIYVPEKTSSGKLTQIISYGAEIHKIKGNREAVAEAAQKNSSNYAGHNWHPMFIEGTKSLAYELWEQNNFESPDNIIAVAGNGSTLLGIYYGLMNLLASRQITQLPRLFAVQSSNCNPIYRKYKNNFDSTPFKETIAEGIALASPNKIDPVIEAVKETNGDILSIDESDIVNALKNIIKYGFYIEPTSAAAYAGLCHLIEANVIKKDESTILIASGNGLKANLEIEKLFR